MSTRFTDTESLDFRNVVFEKLSEKMFEYIYELPSVNTEFYKISESLPNLPGIYFCEMDEKIIYIGKTVSLSNRWNSHKLKYLWGKIRIYYQVYRENNYLFQDIDEVAFISILKPAYNQRLSVVRNPNFGKFDEFSY